VLQQSEQRYRELFDDNPCAMLVYDTEDLHILAQLTTRRWPGMAIRGRSFPR
jgi:hypothetical protein